MSGATPRPGLLIIRPSVEELMSIGPVRYVSHFPLPCSPRLFRAPPPPVCGPPIALIFVSACCDLSPRSCDTCSKQLLNAGMLHIHMRQHTGAASPTKSKPRAAPAGLALRYCCPIPDCGRHTDAKYGTFRLNFSYFHRFDRF